MGGLCGCVEEESAELALAVERLEITVAANVKRRGCRCGSTIRDEDLWNCNLARAVLEWHRGLSRQLREHVVAPITVPTADVHLLHLE